MIAASHRILVRALAKPKAEVLKDMDEDQAHLLHMAVGISTEAGEILSTVKAHAIYGKALDHENILEEVGDLLFYLQGLLDTQGLRLDDALSHNIAKLTKRYPDGMFRTSDAIGRADKQ